MEQPGDFKWERQISPAEPYFDQYFQVAMGHLQAQDEEDKMEAGLSEEVKEKASQERKAALHEKLRPLIEQAFRQHDTSGDGIIGTAGSQAFFESFVDRYSVYMKELYALMLRQRFEMKTMAQSGYGQADLDRLKRMQKQNEKEVKTNIEVYNATFDELVAEYEKNKETYDSAAFAALDSNKDGKLVKEEVVDSLLFFTPKNAAFLNILPTGPGNLMKKHTEKLEKAMKTYVQPQAASIGA
jgi:hypothetical protein